jgi:hypothetical protein
MIVQLNFGPEAWVENRVGREFARQPSAIGENLGACGLTVDDVIDILYRLNSGHTHEFTGSDGLHWPA